MIDTACFSKQSLQIFAKCAQPFLNSPRHTTSSSTHSDRFNSTTISSSVFVVESIAGSKTGNPRSGRGSSQAFSRKEGVDEREKSNEVGESHESHKEKDDIGDEVAGEEEQSAMTDEIISRVAGERSDRKLASGDGANEGSTPISNIRGVLSVKAKFSGPVGMTLELNSGPTGLMEKGKVTETLSVIEPERLTVTEPIILNQILKEKQKKLKENVLLDDFSKDKLCSKSIS